MKKVTIRMKIYLKGGQIITDYFRTDDVEDIKEMTNVLNHIHESFKEGNSGYVHFGTHLIRMDDISAIKVYSAISRKANIYFRRP